MLNTDFFKDPFPLVYYIWNVLWPYIIVDSKFKDEEVMVDIYVVNRVRQKRLGDDCLFQNMHLFNYVDICLLHALYFVWGQGNKET